nr:ankyrin repeat protein [Oriental turtle dovepox virus]
MKVLILDFLGKFLPIHIAKGVFLYISLASISAPCCNRTSIIS